MSAPTAPPVLTVATELAALCVGSNMHSLTALDKAVEEHLSRVDDISAQLDAVCCRQTYLGGRSCGVHIVWTPQPPLKCYCWRHPCPTSTLCCCRFRRERRLQPLWNLATPRS